MVGTGSTVLDAALPEETPGWHSSGQVRSVVAAIVQTVARKSAFLDQVMHGRLDVREIEDIGEATLGFDTTGGGRRAIVVKWCSASTR